MRFALLAFGLMCGACSSAAQMPDAEIIAPHATAMTADSSGVYWATDTTVYARHPGEDPIAIATLDDPGFLHPALSMFHVDGSIVFFRWSVDSTVHPGIRVVSDRGGPIRTIESPDLGAASVVGNGALYTVRGTQLTRVDLATGAATAQSLEQYGPVLDGDLTFTGSTLYVYVGDRLYSAALGPLPLTLQRLPDQLAVEQPQPVVAAGRLVVGATNGGDVETPPTSEVYVVGSDDARVIWTDDSSFNASGGIAIGDDVWFKQYDGFLRVAADDSVDHFGATSRFDDPARDEIATDGTFIYVLDGSDDQIAGGPETYAVLQHELP